MVFLVKLIKLLSVFIYVSLFDEDSGLPECGALLIGK
jgi:hypothetical protein